MRQFIFDFFGYLVFAYSAFLILSYVMMMTLAGRSLLSNRFGKFRSYHKRLMKDNPITPGVSVIAPAYNEEKSIIDSVKSLLSLNYSKFEVVIVNDGSTDRTLENMIDSFELVEVPYDYVEKIHVKPFRRLLKSTDPKYSRLVVVDKDNGGCKADAENAGLNVAQYAYFINTDVDCILSRDAIYQSILPVINNDNVIAVSGAMTMSNGCRVVNGKIMSFRSPKSPLPLFQVLEYMRSFFVGKMSWSMINSMPNVSGGYGLFNRDIIISAGGYRSDSMAEDMEMVFDAVRYCCDFGIPYKIVQIPATCCWTEGPSTLKILYRQRVRWGRGLLQAFWRHRNMIFNPHYSNLGLITMPYMLIFELLAPIIEFTGMLELIYLVLYGGINWPSALIIFIAVYTFNIVLGAVVNIYNLTSDHIFDKVGSYLRTFLVAFFEPFIYHPFITFFSLTGYYKFIFRKKSSWGVMTRKGYGKKSKKKRTYVLESNTVSE